MHKLFPALVEVCTPWMLSTWQKLFRQFWWPNSNNWCSWRSCNAGLWRFTN